MPQQEPSDHNKEEDWEDVSESDEDDEAGMCQKYGKQRAEMLKVNSQNNTLFMTLCMHPKFNMSAPQHSPQPLWFVSDFVRRTCFEYIGPLCPQQDALTVSGPDPGTSDEWPAFDAEKWADAQSRSILIANIILDEKKQFVCGGPFDFGPHARDLARFMLGTPEPEELEGLPDRRPEVVDKLRKRA